MKMIGILKIKKKHHAIKIHEQLIQNINKETHRMVMQINKLPTWNVSVGDCVNAHVSQLDWRLGDLANIIGVVLLR